MSSAPTHVSPPAPANTERRAHPRRRLDQLAYIGFGPDCGGVLLDISQGGLRCQIVGPVIEGEKCHLKFALPGKHAPIESDGQVVWSNRSKQGGGVQLVGLGADVQQELQEWINNEIASPGLKPSAPIHIRTKSVGAVHVGTADLSPVSSAPEFALQSPAAEVAVALQPVVPSEATSLPIKLEYWTVSDAQPSKETAREFALPETIFPVTEPKPEPIPAPVTERIPEAVTPVMPELKTEMFPPPISLPVEAHSSPFQHVAERRVPMAAVHVQPHKSRLGKLTLATGCVVVGAVILAFSGIDPTFGLFGGGAGAGSKTSAPVIVPPAAPANAAMDSTSLSAGGNAASANSKPVLGSETVDHAPHAATQPARPETPVAATSPVPARPAQPPPAAQAADRQQMTMSLPRPRANSPAVANAVAPEPSVAPIVTPPAALMDMGALGAGSSDSMQPARPQTGIFVQPQVLSRVEPAYSVRAREDHLQGSVQINATIGPDGVPRTLVRVSGNPTLADMAIEAIRKWRFQPATLDGRPVQAQTLIGFNFQLR